MVVVSYHRHANWYFSDLTVHGQVILLMADKINALMELQNKTHSI